MIRALVRVLQALLVLITLVVSAPASAAGEPAPSEERVILRTLAGDLVLTLYPSIAPKTVEQFLKLVRAGIYDTTAFVRVEPGFVVQVSAHNDRTLPLNDDQKALIHKLPAEFSSVPHVRGVLSIAREDGDPNSAETSFSILLGPAPHLDGKYTVFGRVENADAVLDEILRVPRGPMKRPVVRIDITHAEVIPSSALDATALAPARPIRVPADLAAQSAMTAAATATAPNTASGGNNAIEIAGGIALMCFIALASFFLQGKVPRSVHGSMNLIIALVGAFMLIVVLVPHGHQNPWLATALFVGLIALLKVLGKFESPAGS